MNTRLPVNEAMTNKESRPIRLLALDVDGVLTDGKLLFTPEGEELKRFCTLDGQGIRHLQRAGIAVAIVTGRRAAATERRAKDLDIVLLLQGRVDKHQALLEICEEQQIDISEVAYVGDDLPDLSAIQACGFGVAVANAHAFVRQHADYVTIAHGGEGAVREVCDLLLERMGLLDSVQQSYLLT